MRIGLGSRPLWAGVVAVGLWATALSGCGSRNPFLSEGPEPRVEDCAQIRQATPSQYVCNGKTYTAVQLSDIRHGLTPIATK